MMGVLWVVSALAGAPERAAAGGAVGAALGEVGGALGLGFIGLVAGRELCGEPPPGLATDCLAPVALGGLGVAVGGVAGGIGGAAMGAGRGHGGRAAAGAAMGAAVGAFFFGGAVLLDQPELGLAGWAVAIPLGAAANAFPGRGRREVAVAPLLSRDTRGVVWTARF